VAVSIVSTVDTREVVVFVACCCFFSITSNVTWKGLISSNTISVQHTFTKDNTLYTVTASASDTLGFCANLVNVSPDMCTSAVSTTVSLNSCEFVPITIPNQKPSFTDPLIVYASQQFDIAAIINISCYTISTIKACDVILLMTLMLCC